MNKLLSKAVLYIRNYAIKNNERMKTGFLKKKIPQSIGKRKELWESLKYLGMPN